MTRYTATAYRWINLRCMHVVDRPVHTSAHARSATWHDFSVIVVTFQARDFPHTFNAWYIGPFDTLFPLPIIYSWSYSLISLICCGVDYSKQNGKLQEGAGSWHMPHPSVSLNINMLCSLPPSFDILSTTIYEKGFSCKVCIIICTVVQRKRAKLYFHFLVE